MRRSTKVIASLALAAPAFLATPLLTARPVAAKAAPHYVEHAAIKGFAFSPKTLTIKPGTTVVWTQKDQAPHTVTSNTGAWVASPDLMPGQTFSHTFTKTGTFAYHCAVHPGMTATVIVSRNAKS